MKEPIIISVIIPVYNTEKYIGKCIESVLNQTIKNLEIIIVDDLSTDNSAAVISDYVEKYDVKYFKLTSKGLAGGARNFGLSKASGKYLGFVDSDDWIDKNMYEEMIKLAEKSNAEIAVCGVLTEYDNAQDTVIRYEYKNEDIIERKSALELLICQRGHGKSISAIPCNKIYKTQFVRKNNYYFLSNNYNDDDIFNFMCFLDVNRVAIAPSTYYHYYQRQDSIMHTFSKKNIDDLIEAFVIIKKHLDKKNIYELYKDTYFQFFEKTLSSVLNILISTETDQKKHDEYIHYFFARGLNFLNISEYMSYVGLQRIKKFLTESPFFRMRRCRDGL